MHIQTHIDTVNGKWTAFI